MTYNEVLPLQGLRVVDLGLGLAAALTAKFLAEAGAEVVRFEPECRDPFYELYPAYGAWRSVLAVKGTATTAAVADALQGADICLFGGEPFDGIELPFPPLANCGNERLICVSIVPALTGSPYAGGGGAEVLVQARTGICYEPTGDAPVMLGFASSAYGACFQALTGIAAALCEREVDGVGQLVEVGLHESAVAMMGPLWSWAEKPNFFFGFRPPRTAKPLILQCRDGRYVHVVLGAAGSKFQLYQALGIEDPTVEPSDPGLPDIKAPPENFYGDIALIAPFAAKRDSTEFLNDLQKRGVVAGLVSAPGEFWNSAQAKCNNIIERAADGSSFVGMPVRWSAPADAKHPGEGEPSGKRPSDLRIVDFGAYVAGPAASVGLADLGAAVTKVEPIKGDALRPTFPFFAAANRGKASISLDIRKPEGREIAKRLTEHSDVICSNFKAGVAERLGIDPATVQGAWPEKIVLLNSGFGLQGPLASVPAFDPVMQAICGIEMRAGGEGNPPLPNRGTPADFVGGYFGQIAVLFALFYRARHGVGLAIEVPLLNAALFLHSDVLIDADGKTIGSVALMADRGGYHPAEKFYATQDLPLAIAARSEGETGRLVAILSLPELADKPRRLWGPKEEALIAAALKANVRSYWLAELEAARIPSAACNERGESELFGDDRFVDLGTVYAAQRSDVGSMRAPAIGYRLGSRPRMPASGISGVGEHSRQIILELGTSEEELRLLIEGSVVREMTS